MSTEKKFTDIILSYKEMLSSLGSEAPRLRDYCKKRQVCYRDFLCWSSTREISSGIVEIERKKKRMQKESVVEVVPCSSRSHTSCSAKPVLYPMHVIPDVRKNGVVSEESSNQACLSQRQSGHPFNLRGVRITFPNGVKITVKEAEGSGLLSLVYGK